MSSPVPNSEETIDPVLNGVKPSQAVDISFKTRPSHVRTPFIIARITVSLTSLLKLAVNA